MSLAVASRGYFCDEQPLGIATRGYFCDIVQVEQPPTGADSLDFGIGYGKLKRKRKREEEEVLAFVASFMRTLDES